MICYNHLKEVISMKFSKYGSFKVYVDGKKVAEAELTFIIG